MIYEHYVEEGAQHLEQRCIRCGVLISEIGNFPFEPGPIYQSGGCLWTWGVKPEYQNEVRPCRTH